MGAERAGRARRGAKRWNALPPTRWVELLSSQRVDGNSLHLGLASARPAATAGARRPEGQNSTHPSAVSDVGLRPRHESRGRGDTTKANTLQSGDWRVSSRWRPHGYWLGSLVPPPRDPPPAARSVPRCGTPQTPPGFEVCYADRQSNKKPLLFSSGLEIGVPTGIRTPVLTVKG